MEKMKSKRRLFGVIAPWIIAAIALYLVYQDHRDRAIRERLEQDRAIERQAVAEIRKLDGFVTYGDPINSWVKSVTFIAIGELNDEGVAVINDTKITDDGLKHLKDLTKLDSLSLHSGKVTDDGLKHLSVLTSLQTLHLSISKVTDAGLEHLKGLTNLKSLSIRSPNVTDKGVERLRQALPNCKITRGPTKQVTVVPNSPQAKSEIDAAIRKAANKPTGELTKADLEKVTGPFLSDDQITDLKPLMDLTNLEELHLIAGVANLKPLAPMQGLEILTLHGNQITDLTPLAELKRLRWLSLTGSRITDLTPLAGLKELDVLRLSTPNIADLTPLTGMKELKTLWLGNNPNLAMAEIGKLQKALPKCKIKHNATE